MAIQAVKVEFGKDLTGVTGLADGNYGLCVKDGIGYVVPVADAGQWTVAVGDVVDHEMGFIKSITPA